MSETKFTPQEVVDLMAKIFENYPADLMDIDASYFVDNAGDIHTAGLMAVEIKKDKSNE